MVTKPKKQSSGSKKGRGKIRKLKINKETVKDLSENETKKIKGGAIPSAGIGVFENDVMNIRGGLIPSVGIQQPKK